MLITCQTGGWVLFIANAIKFTKIPGCSIAYWLSNIFYELFNNKQLSVYADARIGMVSGDNDRFLRLWHEINWDKVSLGATDFIQAFSTGKKWFPIQKGGGKRYWYGNLEYVINYENDGYELKFKNSLNGRVKSHNYNGEKAFRYGITWNSIGTEDIVCRISEKGFLHDAAGPLCTINNEDDTTYFLTLLSSVVAKAIYKFINPTINFVPGTVLSLPVIIDKKEKISPLALLNIEISKNDWDSFETSWDFKKHPLI